MNTVRDYVLGGDGWVLTVAEHLELPIIGGLLPLGKNGASIRID